MKRIQLISILLIGVAFSVTAQEAIFKVQLSSDTLYFGNALGLKYTIENTQGDFEPPQFDGFEIVGGPNVSSQFSMVNGEVSQSASYEYVLRPFEIGTYLFPGASLKQGDNIMYSREVFIYVVENSEGIRQNYRDYNEAIISSKTITEKPLSKEDSLRIKLKKIKAKKI